MERRRLMSEWTEWTQVCEAKDLKLLGDTRIKRSSEGAERKGQQKKETNSSSSTVRVSTASSEAFLCNYIRMDGLRGAESDQFKDETLYIVEIKSYIGAKKGR